MRFRPGFRVTPFVETSRKRAAFLRKQRLEREALPLFADTIAANQHDIEREMECRALRWEAWQRTNRAQRAAGWRKARTRLFALPAGLRQTLRDVWRTCPYPADPASFADFLHQIAVGKLDPYRPPWLFHEQTTAGITANPATFDEAFRQIGRKQVELVPSATPIEELLFCGNLGSGVIFLARRVRTADANDVLHDAALLTCAGKGGDVVEVEVRGVCTESDFATIERLAQAADTWLVIVRRFLPHGQVRRDGGRP